MEKIFCEIKRRKEGAGAKISKFLTYARLRIENFGNGCRRLIRGNAGEGYVDTAVKIIISVVVGALVLGGLYGLFDRVVIPKMAREINSMFDGHPEIPSAVTSAS